MKFRTNILWPWFALLSLLFGLSVHADDDAEESRFTADNATWRAECGSCHLAYPPALLAARDWRQIMHQLDRHYGSDATLDTAQLTQIGTFLESNAGHSAAAETKDLPRITLSPWFKREHREVPARVWKSSAVRSAANCGACHRQAHSGDFSEESLQLPR